MPVTRITIDGLWRCLCPFIDAAASSQLKTSLRRSHTRSIHYSVRSAPVRIPSRASPRCLHSDATTKIYRKENISGQINSAIQSVEVSTASHFPTLAYASLDDVPTSELHDSLRHISNEDGAYHKTADLVEYLVIKRGETPSLLHYDALVRANADASHGSADVVASLLREMKEGAIVPDAGLYHSVLQVLAVHPDYILRSQVLREMQDRWFTLTSDGWHNLVVGLLRDRQYEIALDKLEQMQKEGMRIHPWLYDMFIYLFCEAEELDEAMRLLRSRVDHGDLDISANAWYYVLDACSTHYHYEGTRYIWRKRVETGYINPSDGMCANVLNTAARYHDSSLATDVARVLGGRTSKLDIHHYEALIEAYAGSSNLKTAFQILSIMTKARLEPVESTTRPLYACLKESRHMPSQAFDILESLHKEGQIIPTAAINVIIEAFISQGNLQEALIHYKSLHRICISGPNTATFDVLLQGCSKATGSKTIAMFLASEMVALGVRPDILTYDRLILVCLTEDDYDDAFRYLEEMKVSFDGSEPRLGTLHALVRKCAGARDVRAWDVLEEMEQRGHNIGKLKDLAAKAWENSPRGLDDMIENTRQVAI